MPPPPPPPPPLTPPPSVDTSPSPSDEHFGIPENTARWTSALKQLQGLSLDGGQEDEGNIDIEIRGAIDSRPIGDGPLSSGMGAVLGVGIGPNVSSLEYEGRVEHGSDVENFNPFGSGGGGRGGVAAFPAGSDGGAPMAPMTEGSGIVQKKKPFLRKGSRKEPSSLHRFESQQQQQQQQQKGAATDATSSSPHSNGQNGIQQQRLQQQQQPSHLAALEKMQQDQMDDLERRMERRRNAREQQQQQRQQQQQQQHRLNRPGVKQIQPQQKDKLPEVERVMTARAPYATDDSPPLPSTSTATGTCNTEFSVDDDNEIRGRGGPTTATGACRRGPGGGNTSRQRHQRHRRPGTVAGRSNTVGSDLKPRKGGRAPLRPKNSGNTSTGSSDDRPMTSPSTATATSAEIAAEVDLQKQRNDEQWSLLKSMRRRQEVALRDAEQERETARSWAMGERESVKKWADDQRALIRRERHRASTAAMASQRERQKEEKAKVDALEELEKTSRAEIDSLKSTVEKLRTEMEGAKARYRMSERKLREKVRAQTEVIQQLRSEIAAATDDSRTSHGAVGPSRSMSKSIGRMAPRPRSGEADPKSRESFGTTSREVHGDKKNKQGESYSAEAKESPTGDGCAVDEAPSLAVSIEDDLPIKDGDLEPTETLKVDNRTEEIVKGGKSTSGIPAGSTEDSFVQETTEEWMKRLEERHNVLPILTTTPSASTSDHLLAKANELMSGGSANSGAYGDHLSFQVPTYSTNAANIDTSAASFAQKNHFVAQHTPDQLVGLTRSGIDEVSGSGRRVVTYNNGTTKELFSDGTIKLCFGNKDVKTTYPNGVTVYYYAAAQTTHTSHADVEVFEFPNNQIEKHYRDGKKEVSFADGTIKRIHSDGSSETVFTDGVRILEQSDGTKQIVRG